jgi:ubiquinone/menaquinone biosynthesis C-methylase UbiE
VGCEGRAVTSTTFSGSSDAYEQFMGRYSRPLARAFSDFAGIEAGLRVLDVGAGTGALTDELVRRVDAGNVAAIEPSADYSSALRDRLAGVDVRQGRAEELPWEDATFDAALSQLITVFLEDVPAATREQRRVLREGGIAATCMWEVDGLDMTRALFEVRDRLAPGPRTVELRYRSEDSLRELYESIGLRDVETTVLEVEVEHASVDELWSAAIHVGGPGGPIAKAVPPEGLAQGRALFGELLGEPTGPFTLRGRAPAVKGRR